MTVPPALRALLPVAVLATGGCLATRGDVQRLQLTLLERQEAMRAEQARADSVNRQLIRTATQQLAQQFNREFAAVSDSVRQVAMGLNRLQGDFTLAMHDLRGQLVSVQEGIGQSQRRIQDLRTTVEAVSTPPPVAPSPTAGAAPGAGRGGGAPPAAQLFELARSQLRSGATAAARQGFETLVAEYPTHDRASEAQMYIADAFHQEGNRPAADSVYALVAARYPGTESASRSLYKRAVFAMEAGDRPRAAALAQEIVDKYPRANERDLAEDMLRTLRRP